MLSMLTRSCFIQRRKRVCIRTVAVYLESTRCISNPNGNIRFERHISDEDIAKYNFYSDRDVIPLYQYFLKFSCFDVLLPPIESQQLPRTNYYPLQELRCSWNYTDHYQSLFGTIGKERESSKKRQLMTEYEFCTARALVKYLRNFPFTYTTNESFDDCDEQTLYELTHTSDRYHNAEKIVDFDRTYYSMFEEKADLMHCDMNRMVVPLPLAKNTTKALIKEHKCYINGYLIDRSEFFLKANDHIIFDIPAPTVIDNCQRRLFEYLFKLYRIYNRKNDSVEQFLNSSQFRTVIKKTKQLRKYPSQSIELTQKLCVQKFSDHMVHAIRHCIIPHHCGLDETQAQKIIIYEDDDIIVCNKPCGMAVHFAKEAQKYHTESLINLVLYYCRDLQRNIQKDSHMLQASRLQNPHILPAAINELQLTISPGMVHRIDRQTSGLVVIAKTIFAMSNLLKQWKFHQHVEREYIVLVHGKFDGNALRVKYDDKDIMFEAQYCGDDDDDEHEDDDGGGDGGDDGDRSRRTQRNYDDIYSADVTYSTFYEQEEFEQLYGEHYANIKLENDKKDFQFGFDDADYYKCECWIGPKAVQRHLPLTCFNTKEYKAKKTALGEARIDPYKVSCSHFYKLREYHVNGHTFTLLKCVLVTGRTHQVRLHLQYLGMAVVGDRIYPRVNPKAEHTTARYRWRPRANDEHYMGSDVEMESNLFAEENECQHIDWYHSEYHALHAQKLKFNHPTTEQRVDFTADLPPFYESMIRKLEKIHQPVSTVIQDETAATDSDDENVFVRQRKRKHRKRVRPKIHVKKTIRARLHL